ncbi:MAG: histidinol-phosphate transaminase [Oscillospiraceae bacterium]
MPYKLNDKIKNLTPYEPIAGDYRIRLDANESFISLSREMIHKVMLASLDVEANRYPDPYAIELLKRFGSFYGIPHDYITAGNGSDELIALIVSTFFMKGEELITLANDFSMYRFYGETFEVKTSIFPKKDDLTIDIDGLIYYANSSKAKGIIFSNPCNPTSICLKKEEVLRIVQSVDCLVIVDEAYMDFADESISKVASEYDNLIVLKTCSKALGLAGIRLGFAIANENITKALRAVKSPYNVNSMTQSIGTVVLSEQEYVNSCIEKIIRSRDNLYSGILSIYARYNVFDIVYKTSTNFVFVKTASAKRIFDELLKRSIAIRTMGDYLRITAGTKQENEAVLDAIEDIIKNIEG